MKVDKKNLVRSANQNEKRKNIETLSTSNSLTQSNNKSQENHSEILEFQEKFIPKKKKTEILANSFYRIGEKKRGERVRNCGTFLAFAHEIFDDGVIDDKGRLHNANFCRERLCPLCIWRRTLKIYGQISKIMVHMPKNVSYLFLTLTIPNCTSEDFQNTIQRLFDGWYNLSHSRKFKISIKGYYRVLEVTRNKKNNTYHPHFHVILAVDNEYFHKNYISHSEWLNMWRLAYGDNSITQVDIRKIRPRYKSLSETTDLSDLDGFKSLEGAVSETAKYTVKDDDFIISNDTETMDSVVKTLLFGLKGRRLVQFGGIFKEVAKKLKLDDVEDGDLTHIDDDKINGAVANMIIKYGWRSGVYTIISKEIKKVGEK